MPVAFSVALRACCVAGALLVAPVRAAEQSSSLIGATREQVLARYGEPRSQIASGDRIVFFYARERIVLRDNIVTEVEQIAAEPTRRPSVADPSAPVATPAPDPSATPPSTTPTTPSAGPAPATPPAPAPAPEPKLEIKLVRPPSTKDGRTTPIPPTPAAPSLEPVAPKSAPTPDAEKIIVPPQPSEPVKPREDASSPSVESQPSAEAIAARKAAERAAAAEKEKKAKAVRDARRKLDEAGAIDPTEGVFTLRNVALAIVILGGGLGFLVWRSRQRRLELEATSVSNTPTSVPSAPAKNSGTVFTADLLKKLEWKRFEELVAAYYSKTGVVASRTNTGPGSPVHIKISWKGEPRPFAYVQCIAHPTGLIEPKPVQDLIAVLAAEDIRRGYVVTAGKFSATARSLAEEKQITLLPGDVFLEKLNALPASARSEVMRETGGDV